MSPTMTDEVAYLHQRMAEEHSRAASSSCVVRSVHDDFAEAYQERIDTIERDEPNAFLFRRADTKEG